MRIGVIRSAVQGVVSIGVAYAVVKIPALQPYLSESVQSIIVGVSVPLVVALQLYIEKKFPIIGLITKSPTYVPLIESAIEEVLTKGLGVRILEEGKETDSVSS